VTTGRRVHERYERHLDVVIIHDGGEVECLTRNVSLGGMLLATTVQIPYGSKVRLRMHLPALKEATNIEATIRWVKDDSIGVQFGSLRAREVWALNQLFKEGDGPIVD
jgi:hypothetical protein